uniref:Bestrophin homolog n=1 Tax=Saccoglossus kowalevskii TaxID=10224 RepID=A0ABM0N048_SACKO|nr:PREDICTED: bestrophin-2-like [Saccoglossus kowalevskii]
MPTPHVKWWLPISWCCNLVGRLKADGKVDGEMADLLLKEIQAHRQACGAMMDYDWISIPLVYTQVVTIATYTFFLAKLFSSQFLESSTEVDLYFPIILVFEFLFYFGWLKVAEVIINPYGDDDDDFEINYILDRTYQIGLLIVDDCYDMVPELEKDKYWVTPDFCLPNCKSTTADNQGKAWLGSTVPGGLLLSAKHFILGHTWNGFAKNINHKYSAAKVALQMTPGVDPQTEISASSDYDQTWAAKREAGFNGNDDDIPMQELPDKSIDDKPRKYELRLSKKGPSNDTVEVKMPCGVCLGIKEGTLKEVEHLDHPTK